MRKNREQDRRRAIERYLEAESPSAVCASMGYSGRWFYKWLSRFESGDAHWFQDRSCRPHRSPTRTKREVEELVMALRRHLSTQGLFHGDQALRWELEDLEVHPLPSVRTIARIVARHGLTRRRTGRYQPRGKPYPAPVADGPGAVHQSDFIGPRHLKGPIRFYSLNSVDVATNRCAVEPLLTRRGQQTIDAFWASWCCLGLPQHQQVDNESVFYGSAAYPRGMGMLIRLCLPQGVEPWFIPPGEPWRNGVVEKFNDHWQQKLLRRTELGSAAALCAASQRFEARHNSRYRYSKLGGKTPGAALAASRVTLRFPATPQAPRHPLPKPEHGRYHLVRFVRSDGLLDVFTEKFPAPPETVYEYVRLTIDVERQRLLVFLDNTQIDAYDYQLQ